MPIKIQDLQIDLFDRIDAEISQIDRMHLQVGWFQSAKYDDNTPVAAIAAQNEYGNPLKGIPPRPFIRPTIAENTDLWTEFIGNEVTYIISGDRTGEEVMGNLGHNVAGSIRKTISNLYDPPLSPVTIKRRLAERANKTMVGSLDKPLVFEGIMMNSVSYIVNDGEEVSPFSGG
jgi:hypothetical protein